MHQIRQIRDDLSEPRGAAPVMMTALEGVAVAVVVAPQEFGVDLPAVAVE